MTTENDDARPNPTRKKRSGIHLTRAPPSPLTFAFM